MKRVMIIGSGGAGKSTAALALNKITRIPVVHLDHYYWKPDWVETPKEEWENTVRTLCEKEKWIMDGNYGGTLDHRFDLADTVFFLHLPRLICLSSALKRRFFARRIDTIPGCPERVDYNFLSWIWNYNRTRAPRIIGKLEKLEGKTVYIIKSRSWLRKVLAEIEKGGRK